MTGNGPAFADTPARTWQLIISSVLDFVVIALIVTAITLWASAGDLPRTLTMSLGTLTTIVVTITWWRFRTRLGTSPGHLLLGLRAVDPVTGLPGKLPGFRANLNAGWQDPDFIAANEEYIFPKIKRNRYYLKADYDLRDNVTVYGKVDFENTKNYVDGELFSKRQRRELTAGISETF